MTAWCLSFRLKPSFAPPSRFFFRTQASWPPSVYGRLARRSGNLDLENFDLCAHIHQCARNEKCTCFLAHSFVRLLQPKEVCREYIGIWRDRVDRWGGLHTAAPQRRPIAAYYYSTSSGELGVWAVGLQLFYCGHVSPLASVGA